MVFESQVKRQVILQVLLAVLVDVALAALAASVARQGLFVAFLVFVGLQLLSILYMVLRSIVAWVLFMMAGKAQGVRWFLGVLRQNKFPAPGEYERSPRVYFDKIVADDSQPTTMRLRAAEIRGALDALGGIEGFQAGLRREIMMETALAQYRDMWEPAGAPALSGR